MEVGTEDYCRQIEAYLCRRNEGHLIRIVGPAFEMVCGWADRGVPLTVAFRGIDRCVDRHQARGPRRRPVRIDFCEADVLDAFDEWRRAVGVPLAEDVPRASRTSLADHVDRVIARLTAVRAGEDRRLEGVLDSVIGELDASRAAAKTARGTARAHLLTRLATLDAEVMAAARARLGASELEDVRREAEAELTPFRGRMTGEAYAESLAACVDRVIRERARLPVVAFE